MNEKRNTSRIALAVTLVVLAVSLSAVIAGKILHFPKEEKERAPTDTGTAPSLQAANEEVQAGFSRPFNPDVGNKMDVVANLEGWNATYYATLSVPDLSASNQKARITIHLPGDGELKTVFPNSQCIAIQKTENTVLLTFAPVRREKKDRYLRFVIVSPLPKTGTLSRRSNIEIPRIKCNFPSTPFAVSYWAARPGPDGFRLSEFGE